MKCGRGLVSRNATGICTKVQCFQPGWNIRHPQVEAGEEREIVRQALERLNERNREAVSLYYVNGFSYQDISGFLGVSETTVQGRLQRGRQELKRAIEMVERTFNEHRLPADFSSAIHRLLESVAREESEHKVAVARLVEIGESSRNSIIYAAYLSYGYGIPRRPLRPALF